MELGLHFTELTCCEQTGRLVMSHEETMETAIAEYCPDMTRIVSVCGQLQIRERTALEGRVTATGTVRVSVSAFNTSGEVERFLKHMARLG